MGFLSAWNIVKNSETMVNFHKGMAAENGLINSFLLPLCHLFFLSSSLLTFLWKVFHIHTQNSGFCILISQNATSPRAAHVWLTELWQRAGFHINTMLHWSSSCLPGHAMVNGQWLRDYLILRTTQWLSVAAHVDVDVCLLMACEW